jgi:uncharacterized OB-fold protein
MEGFIVLILIIGLAVVFLRGFDRVSGRGPKQIKDGLNQSKLGQREASRIPCPHCAELILPAAKKCPFCKSEL